MLFSGTVFIYLFLPGVLLLYYVAFRWSRTAQNIFLLLASLFFYAWGEPKFVFVMIGSIVINWFLGLLADKLKDNEGLGRLALIADIIFNLGLLFVYKYLAFTGTIIRKFFGAEIHTVSIALPIGISFFTFQAMSYVIDVYRRNAPVQKNLFYVGVYISFFPQLIAGPIVRYKTVSDQIVDRKETLEDLAAGFERFVIGLAKKVLLANSFAVLADQAFAANQKGSLISAAFCWLGAVSYTLQIYFDFCGYSDMAIGLGRMFGFHFPENFNYPYISASVTEFWRRWHISLGTWFRDYLYIPLGGNRCKKWRNILNLFCVWLLTGLWHGANTTFVAWGMMYFILLVFERYIKFDNRKHAGLKWVYTIFLVVIGWVIFRAESMHAAVDYLAKMFALKGNPLADGLFTGWFSQNVILLCIGLFAATPVMKDLYGRTKDHVLVGFIKTVVLAGLFILSVASLVSSSYNPFIYFQF